MHFPNQSDFKVDNLPQLDIRFSYLIWPCIHLSSVLIINSKKCCYWSWCFLLICHGLYSIQKIFSTSIPLMQKYVNLFPLIALKITLRWYGIPCNIYKDERILNYDFKIFKIYNISPQNAFIKYHKGDKSTNGAKREPATHKLLAYSSTDCTTWKVIK